MVTLKQELEKWIEHEKTNTIATGVGTVSHRQAIERHPPMPACREHREKVAGGEIIWKPIDKSAALMIAKAPWWAHPPQIGSKKNEPEKTQPKQKKERKRMKQTEKQHFDKQLNETSFGPLGVIQPTQYDANGNPLWSPEEITAFIYKAVRQLPDQVNPNIKAAQDARRIITELTAGIGTEIEKFRADTKMYLEDIRNTRFAVVSETSNMAGPLKEIRQFFLGGDYKEQRDRLADFVSLCERLQKLKESGFLDMIADTMIKMA